MTEQAEEREGSDEQLLVEMLQLADRLCRTKDAFFAGQYEFLRSRIDALAEIRRARNVQLEN